MLGSCVKLVFSIFFFLNFFLVYGQRIKATRITGRYVDIYTTRINEQTKHTTFIRELSRFPRLMATKIFQIFYLYTREFQT